MKSYQRFDISEAIVEIDTQTAQKDLATVAPLAKLRCLETMEIREAGDTVEVSDQAYHTASVRPEELLHSYYTLPLSSRILVSELRLNDCLMTYC